MTWELHSFRNPHRVRVELDCGTETLVKQSYKDECDIHFILSQYQRTGIIDHIASRPGAFIDLPDSLDFQQSLDVIKTAETAFADLPAIIRDRFQNNPTNFLTALRDPALKAELVELGVFMGQNQTAPETLAEPSSEPRASKG